LQPQQKLDSAPTLRPQLVQLRQDFSLPQPQPLQNLAPEAMRLLQFGHLSVKNQRIKDMAWEGWGV
jgi:hypothetical protein